MHTYMHNPGIDPVLVSRGLRRRLGGDSVRSKRFSSVFAAATCALEACLGAAAARASYRRRTSQLFRRLRGLAFGLPSGDASCSSGFD